MHLSTKPNSALTACSIKFATSFLAMYFKKISRAIPVLMQPFVYLREARVFQEEACRRKQESSRKLR